MNSMTWLDVGWHFDIVVLVVLVIPFFVTAFVVIRRNDRIDRRAARLDRREQQEWRERAEERSYRKELRKLV